MRPLRLDFQRLDEMVQSLGDAIRRGPLSGNEHSAIEAVEGAPRPSAERRRKPAKPVGPTNPGDFFSIAELARRWRCSRGTVYNRLRFTGARVLDFAPRGKRSRKAVAVGTVLKIEAGQSKRLR